MGVCFRLPLHMCTAIIDNGFNPHTQRSFVRRPIHTSKVLYLRDAAVVDIHA